eukprot:6883093-Pyramimonas_sp.AAC.1
MTPSREEGGGTIQRVDGRVRPNAPEHRFQLLPCAPLDDPLAKLHQHWLLVRVIGRWRFARRQRNCQETEAQAQAHLAQVFVLGGVAEILLHCVQPLRVLLLSNDPASVKYCCWHAEEAPTKQTKYAVGKCKEARHNWTVVHAQHVFGQQVVGLLVRRTSVVRLGRMLEGIEAC